MAQYRTGTVNVANGNATVTGVGTHWTDDIVGTNDLFALQGGGRAYKISSVSVTAQTITLAETYKGVTANGVDYSITRDFTPNHNLPLLSPGDDTAPFLAELARLLDGIVPATGPAPTNTQGSPGTNAYAHVGYASDDAGSDFSTTPTASTRYIGFIYNDTATPPAAAAFQGVWMQIGKIA